MMKSWKRIPESRLLFLILTGTALFVLGLMITVSDKVVQFHPLVVLTCLINIALFAYQFLRAINHHAFGLDMLHWLFCLFFLGFAPLARHMANSHSWDLIPTNGEFVLANLCYTLWGLCYILGRDYRRISRLRKVTERLARFVATVKERITGKLPDFRELGDKTAEWL